MKQITITGNQEHPPELVIDGTELTKTEQDDGSVVVSKYVIGTMSPDIALAEGDAVAYQSISGRMVTEGVVEEVQGRDVRIKVSRLVRSTTFYAEQGE